MWLKNWACHVHLKFKIEVGMVGSNFELHPQNFQNLNKVFEWYCCHFLKSPLVFDLQKLNRLGLHVSPRTLCYIFGNKCSESILSHLTGLLRFLSLDMQFTTKVYSLCNHKIGSLKTPWNCKYP